MRYYLSIFVLVILLGVPWVAYTYPEESQAWLASAEQAGSQLAAVIITHDPKTVAGLQSTYDTANLPTEPKVRILIVPGHEPDYGGAEYASPFGDIKERDLTVQLGQDLQTFLDGNDHYQVYITRDTQAWNPVFADYFKNEWNDIIAWRQAHVNDITNLTQLGQFQTVAAPVNHITDPTDVALRIYGIDKWVDDNNIDIAIHIHFNDYPGHGDNPGKYNGFAIYVPQKEYDNSSTTKAVADTIFKRLAKYNPVSDLPGESTGIVEDQDLIAIGPYNTVNAASMLIEYAYIYEPQLDDPAVQATFIKELAYETYLGLQDFFDPTNAAKLGLAYDTLVLPHSWQSPLTDTATTSTDVFALQTALLEDGDYPPAGKDMSDCPRTGKIGECTKDALQAFQTKYDITGENGVAGPKTIQELNQLYSAKEI